MKRNNLRSFSTKARRAVEKHFSDIADTLIKCDLSIDLNTHRVDDIKELLDLCKEYNDIQGDFRYPSKDENSSNWLSSHSDDIKRLMKTLDPTNNLTLMSSEVVTYIMAFGEYFNENSWRSCRLGERSKLKIYTYTDYIGSRNDIDILRHDIEGYIYGDNEGNFIKYIREIDYVDWVDKISNAIQDKLEEEFEWAQQCYEGFNGDTVLIGFDITDGSCLISVVLGTDYISSIDLKLYDKLPINNDFRVLPTDSEISTEATGKLYKDLFYRAFKNSLSDHGGIIEDNIRLD